MPDETATDIISKKLFLSPAKTIFEFKHKVESGVTPVAACGVWCNLQARMSSEQQQAMANANAQWQTYFASTVHESSWRFGGHAACWCLVAGVAAGWLVGRWSYHPRHALLGNRSRKSVTYLLCISNAGSHDGSACGLCGPGSCTVSCLQSGDCVGCHWVTPSGDPETRVSHAGSLWDLACIASAKSLRRRAHASPDWAWPAS